jgi:hypothetical protein
MKTITMPILLLCAALSFQCSDDNGSETDELSDKPLPGDINTPDIPAPDDSIDILGYTDLTNAQLIVTGVDSVEAAPEFAYVADWIQGLGIPGYNTTSTTDVFFDLDSDSFLVTTPEAPRYNLLCVSDALGTLFLPQWDLTYAFDGFGGLSISGRGKGTHVPDAMFLYLEQSDALEASEVIFEFRGESVIGTLSDVDVKGAFSIIENSPEASYSLAIYGTLAIKFNISY